MAANDLTERKRRYAQEGGPTVGELREQLAVFDDDALVIFSGTQAGSPLAFARLKNRGQRPDGTKLIQVELIEVTDELFRGRRGGVSEMENFRIVVRTVDGGAQDFDFASGRETIETLLTDDWGPPPSVMTIEATAEDGTRVSIHVPYDESDRAGVTVQPPNLGADDG